VLCCCDKRQRDVRLWYGAISVNGEDNNVLHAVGIFFSSTRGMPYTYSRQALVAVVKLVHQVIQHAVHFATHALQDLGPGRVRPVTSVGPTRGTIAEGATNVDFVVATLTSGRADLRTGTNG
jgi:hypothetical protein